MDVTIRAAREAEYGEVGDLTADAYLEDGLLTHGARDPYLEVLRNVPHRAGHAQVLVAVDAGTGDLLGTVTFVGDGGEYANIARPGEAEFRMLAVHRKGRGRGVGEALVRDCLARARALGRERVVLSTESRMTTAHRLYGRLRFVRTPARDWEPIPGLPLWTFALELADDEG
ncbi:GNAT family N-acetyltransferase [Streptomyces sp. RKND-216]|uniref:GNAT family N-acetyltransferase n=1 Tax=Streptomyces sp. RKND-216 TaxID=2562581 RepID=UPI00109DEAD9|nr:GNAT family N-acetyltransferase [Streptomyces sp. RKND-216]THA24587.1 GNAT family N-acetyltransferase [Streptomyces sp. RKND-216]